MRVSDREGVFLAIVVGFICAMLIALSVGWWENVADGCDEVCTVALAVQRLQPAADDERAEELAGHFIAAGEETGFDPLLLLAIARRESSLAESVERLERLGSRGERGLLQVHGAALRARPRDCPASLEGARCQVRTGARWLAYVRDRCQGSTWVTVAAYGWSRCPSEGEARRDRNAAIAASFYAQAGGTSW